MKVQLFSYCKVPYIVITNSMSVVFDGAYQWSFGRYTSNVNFWIAWILIKKFLGCKVIKNKDI